MTRGDVPMFLDLSIAGGEIPPVDGIPTRMLDEAINWIEDAIADTDDDEAGLLALNILSFIRDNPATVASAMKWGDVHAIDRLVRLAYGWTRRNET